MFIKIKELELRKIEYDENIAPGQIDLGQEVTQTGVVRATGRAELIRENRGPHEVVEDIRLVGRFSAKVETLCGRCLDPVEHSLTEEFDLIYRPTGVDAVKEDASIGLAETEIGYYRGEGLELNEVIKEQILLALPIRPLCRADCKGLCPRCGSNRNVESCDCAQTVADPRWSALEDLRKKLES
ncbi:MAG TPA: DUF177 domain-containing protein [Candidatus Angelobacter sp.]|nr:DUF177 domain-containing protein [Candidatus Angelobacter sp.]